MWSLRCTVQAEALALPAACQDMQQQVDCWRLLPELSASPWPVPRSGARSRLPCCAFAHGLQSSVAETRPSMAFHLLQLPAPAKHHGRLQNLRMPRRQHHKLHLQRASRICCWARPTDFWLRAFSSPLPRSGTRRLLHRLAFVRGLLFCAAGTQPTLRCHLLRPPAPLRIPRLWKICEQNAKDWKVLQHYR